MPVVSSKARPAGALLTAPAPAARSKARRRAGALLVASVAVLFTAACGGSAEDSSSGTSTDQSGGNSAFSAYISCLNENGVAITMPSAGAGMGNGGARPSGAPGGARPSGAPDGGGFPDGVAPSGQPRPSGSAGQRGGGGTPGGGMFQQPDGVDDATWEKAQSACASVRPSMGAGRGQGGTSAGGGADAAYTNCLTENGVKDTANLDTSDATTKKATETCAVLKPAATATS